MLLLLIVELIHPGSLSALAGKISATGVRALAIVPLATIPFTTAYSVLVHRVLDVRLIARRALQYLLARYTTFALAMVPLVAMTMYVLRHRERTVADLLSGKEVLVLGAIGVVGLFTFRYRQRVLDAIDRRFFRERYDSRQLLSVLVEQIRSVSSARQLAELLTDGIDRALHVESACLFVSDARSGWLRDPAERFRPFDPTTALGSLAAAAREPLTLDLESPRSAVMHLPETDRHWLADGRFLLLTPLNASDGQLIGLLALGAKRSGLPYLAEDREILTTVAHSAALVLEVQALRQAGREAPPREETDPTLAATARECFACGSVYSAHTHHCVPCERPLEPALVPYVLPGKFRFEQRLGAGGMGVVYRAVDLSLGRPVAVKTLRRISPEDAVRLRREARAAAAVTHPNLAFIYGVETWHGTPMLILEYLEGGTLADRLRAGRLSPLDAVELGIALAGALESLHRAKILHRDVKPSNIGYTRDHTPKLTDFGIARLAFDVQRDTAVPGQPALDPLSTQSPTLLMGAGETSPSQRLVGTLFYVPPETLENAPPDARFDLWSLNVVLYEGLSGRRLFDGSDVRAVMRAIRAAEVPDLRRHRPDCPAALAEHFTVNLHRRPERRAASAGELRDQLERVMRALAS